MNGWARLKQGIQRGFTIIELLIVIVVIGLLTAIIFVGYGAVTANAHDNAVKDDLTKISDAAKLYALNHGGTFPAGTSELSQLNLKLSNGSFYTADAANVYFCSNMSRTEFAAIAKSRSGKRFVVKSEQGVSEYTGSVVWDASTTNFAETCADINADYVPVGGSIAAMYGGSWVGWAGTGIAITCPNGFIVVPGNSTFGTSDFCVMKYEAKNVGGVATSEANGTPWVSISQIDAITTSQNACAGCHLITQSEWLTIAHNLLNVASNWTGGVVGSGSLYTGHSDLNPIGRLEASVDDGQGYTNTGNTSPSIQRRTLTLSNGEVIWDLSGNVGEWTDGVADPGRQPGTASSAYGSREWNLVGMQFGDFEQSFPSFGNPAASAWTSTQGIGTVYSSTNEMTQKAVLMGGRFSNGSNAGIFNINFGLATNQTDPTFGFRVAR